MKTILKTIIMTLGCLLPAVKAEPVSISVREATARVIPVAEVQKCENRDDLLPQARVGMLLSNSQRLVYTVPMPGEQLSDSNTSFLVLFPEVNEQAGTVAVRAYLGVYVNKADSEDFITLTLPTKEDIPAAIAVDKLEGASSLVTGEAVQMFAFSNDQDPHRADKDKDNILNLNNALSQLLKVVRNSSGSEYARISNDSLLFSALMAYMNPYVQQSNVSSNNQQTADSNRCTIPNLLIDSTRYGSPVLRNNTLVAFISATGSPITSKAIVGNAYQRNIELDGGNVTLRAKQVPEPPIVEEPVENPILTWIKANKIYILIGAAVVLVIGIVWLLMPDGKNPPVMTLQTEDGVKIKVTAAQVRSKTLIGRSSSAGIRIAEVHKSVSGSHARLCSVGNRAAIRDEGSTNGTFVNGERLKAGEPKSLHPGDEIKLGTYKITVL